MDFVGGSINSHGVTPIAGWFWLGKMHHWGTIHPVVGLVVKHRGAVCAPLPTWAAPATPPRAGMAGVVRAAPEKESDLVQRGYSIYTVYVYTYSIYIYSVYIYMINISMYA